MNCKGFESDRGLRKICKGLRKTTNPVRTAGLGPRFEPGTSRIRRTANHLTTMFGYHASLDLYEQHPKMQWFTNNHARLILFICNLFNDALCATDDFLASNERLDEWWIEKYVVGSGCSLIWREYPGTFLKELRKTKNLSHDTGSPGRDLNTGPPEYEGVPTTRPRRSVTLVLLKTGLNTNTERSPTAHSCQSTTKLGHFMFKILIK
jgi:hypothetical protein